MWVNRMIYYTFFLISYISLVIFDKRTLLQTGSKSYQVNIGKTVTVVLMALLAGARSLQIGKDTINYYYSFNSASYRLESIEALFSDVYEPGFAMFEKVVRLLTDKIFIIFVIETLIIFYGLFCILQEFETVISVPMAVFTFMTLYYNNSLNTSRQYVALGIGMIASKYLLRKKYVAYVALCIVAISIHYTAVLLLLSLLMWKYINKGKNAGKKESLVIVLAIIVCLFFESLVRFFVSGRLLNAKYLIFLQESSSSSSLFKAIIVSIPVLVLIYVYKKDLVRLDYRNYFIITMSVLNLLFNFLNSFFGTSGRLGIFFGFWQVILFGECYKIAGINKSRINKYAVRILFMLAFSFYWYYTIVFRNFGDTYPYVSDSISWLNWSI